METRTIDESAVDKMVLEVLAHVRQVKLHGNTQRLEHLRVSDPAQLEDLRGLDRAVASPG